MNILYLGDIMASPGRAVVAKMLPRLRTELAVDVVAAQAENVSHGKSMTPRHMRELQEAGVDFFTGGNHTIECKSLQPLLADPHQPVICPANMEAAPAEWGAKALATSSGNVLFISLLGDTVPQSLPMRNPLQTIDKLLGQYQTADLAAIVVNFHGDYSSQKKIMGYYVDGRVSVMVGDHWHIQTADAEILPGGTAYQTDVGMCGTLHSSLGVAYQPLAQRWRDDVAARAGIEEKGPFQLNALLVKVDPSSRRAIAVQSIREVYNDI